MSPDPENPQQGKAGDTSPEDAAAAKQNVEATPEQPEPAAASDAEPQAEGTAHRESAHCDAVAPRTQGRESFVEFAVPVIPTDLVEVLPPGAMPG